MIKKLNNNNKVSNYFIATTYLLIVLLLSLTKEGFCSLRQNRVDSIRVYIIGENFKNERYIFYDYLARRTYYKKVKPGTNFFSFYVYINDSIKSGELINVQCFRKGFLGIKYFNTKIEIRYDPGNKYLVLLRDFRVKDRYSFTVQWWEKKTIHFGKEEFWIKDEIDEKYKCDKIEYW